MNGVPPVATAPLVLPVPPNSRRGSPSPAATAERAAPPRHPICDLGAPSPGAPPAQRPRRHQRRRPSHPQAPAPKHRGREKSHRERMVKLGADRLPHLSLPASLVARESSRRGMTFLEVILATAMLALVTASVFSAINFAVGSQARHEQLLGAAEVASRVVVMYLDDPDATLAQQGRPMDYGPLRYRWSASSAPITLEIDADAAAQSGAVGAAPSLSRLEELTVHVWLSEESGGSRDPAPGLPQVSLKRMLDMNPTFRNPDSLEGAMESSALLERIMGPGGGGGGGGDRGGEEGGRRRGGGGGERPGRGGR